MGSRVQRGYFDYRNNNAVPGRTLRQFGRPTGSMTVNINAMDSKSIGSITLRSPTRWPWQCSAAVRLFSVSSFQTLAKGAGLWELREMSRFRRHAGVDPHRSHERVVFEGLVDLMLARGLRIAEQQAHCTRYRGDAGQDGLRYRFWIYESCRASHRANALRHAGCTTGLESAIGAVPTLRAGRG